ncbi:MAG: hypothetical protein HeimC3_05400 [Candidatus Heimdallarchaeota archaeon LC_3]|nr:MAG: hypothetical protein HeimC3_05400 [Candidatus Heimdallarchaeota archaeon LC_3]
MVPEERLQQMNGLNQMVSSFLLVISPAIGAMLIGNNMSFSNIGSIMWIDIITFFISLLALLVIYIPKPRKKMEEKKTFKEDLTEGVSFIKKSGLVPFIFIFASLFSLTVPLIAFFPILVTAHHSGGASELAILNALFWIGIMIGVSILMALNTSPKIRTIIGSSLIMIIGMIIIATAPNDGWIQMYLGTFVMGFAVGIIQITALSILQLVTPEELQGRISALIMSSLIPVLLPVMILAGGIIAEIYGVILFII